MGSPKATTTFRFRRLMQMTVALAAVALLGGCSLAGATPTAPTPNVEISEQVDDTATPGAEMEAATPTLVPVATLEMAAADCKVATAQLNLRRGGGVEHPVIRALSQGTALDPLARGANVPWIKVRVRETGEDGWLNAAPTLVECSVDLAGLPLEEAGGSSNAGATAAGSGVEGGVDASLPFGEPSPTRVPAEGPPAAGIDASLPFGVPFIFRCSPAHLSPGDFAALGTVEIAEQAGVCFDDFDGDQPIVVTVVRPDGISEPPVTIGTDDDLRLWVRAARPGDPEGEYSFTARQGGLEATGSFIVVGASNPHILVVPPNAGRPGATFEVALAGFQAREAITLHVYHDEQECVLDGQAEPRRCFLYQRSLPPIRMNARGEAIASITTAVDDPVREYRIITNRGRSYGTFFLRSADLGVLPPLAPIEIGPLEPSIASP